MTHAAAAAPERTDAAAGTGLHARLRAATGPSHAALERSLDWQARVATREGYRDLLARLHGFHAAWEPAIGRALAEPAFFDPRRRFAALEADLRHLGLGAQAIAVLPRPGTVRLDGPAAAIGALYVLEGSTLGGRVIGRHVGALHGIDGAGLAYYGGRGRDAGPMWAAFRARLDGTVWNEAVATTAEDSAVAAFDAMRIWLCAAAG